jgi:UDP-glucose 4-epimerase
MRVLVTGGAGYIGSVVAEECLRSGFETVVIDSLEKGHRAAVPRGAPFVHANIAEREVLRETLMSFKIEAVIHLAAYSLVGESVEFPEKYFKNNVENGIVLLDTMAECGVKKIVFSSTAAVYGEPEKQPIEEDDATVPTNPYGETKLAFENALSSFQLEHGIQHVSLRYFNAAGATYDHGEHHEPETHLIPLALQVAAGTRGHIDVFGDDYPTRDGTCVRDYIHVIDLAKAHILALNTSTESTVYNLGCGGLGYSVNEVLTAAEEVTGRPIRRRIVQRRPGDPPTLIASSQKITTDLGWKPEHQSLHRIIESAWSLTLRKGAYEVARH